MGLMSSSADFLLSHCRQSRVSSTKHHKDQLLMNRCVRVQ